LPAAAVGEDLVILGPFSRRVSLEIGGVVRTGRIDTWETVLHPLAARLGGRTLKGFPGTIEAMAPHIQAADRIVFFTAPKLGPLTSEEMALIQSSDAFRLKSTFVYGGID
jgi:hypothetical protein